MTSKTKQIADMIDMLPDSDKDFAFEFVRRMVLAWDPDYTKLTPAESVALDRAMNGEYTNGKDIDWN